MPTSRLDVRSDCGVGRIKTGIGLCLFFSLMLIPLTTTLFTVPPEKAKIVDQVFFVACCAMLVAGSCWLILLYFRRLKKIPTLDPVVRIDEQGIHCGPALLNFIEWSEVEALSEHVYKRGAYLIEASLVVQLDDERTEVIDLLHLDAKPEVIVALARDLHRRSQGIKQFDLQRSEVACPRCLNPTRDLKSFQTGTILILVFKNAINLHHTVCCRDCMRKIFLRDSLVNLLTCHFAWPFVWLGAVILPQIGKVVSTGHDPKALELLS